MEPHFPLTTAPLVVWILLSAAGMTPVVATVTGINDDICSAMGACLAAAFVVMYGRERGHSLLRQAFALLASVAVGVMLPGSLVYWYWPQAVARMTWQMWGGMGLVCGLAGSVLVNSLISIFASRIPDGLNAALDRVFGPKENPAVRALRVQRTQEVLGKVVKDEFDRRNGANGAENGGQDARATNENL